MFGGRNKSDSGGALSVLSAIGRSLNMAAIYGADHFRTQAAMGEAWQHLAPMLGAASQFAIGMASGKLLVNGKDVDTRGNPLVKTLETRLASLKTTGFTLSRGIREEEFRQLLALISTQRAGGLDRALRATPFRHVRSDLVEWQAVKVGQKGGPAPAPSTTSSAPAPASSTAGPVLRVDAISPAAPPHTAPMSGAAPQVQQIIAFLKGDAGANLPAAKEALAQFANDADRLASLILRAATIQNTAANVATGESVADLVIGCLRRTYDGLRDSSASSTPQKQLEMRKALLLLENNIVRRLHESMRGPDPAIDARISKAVEEMTGELEVDLVAAEFVEYRKALERGEKRLGQYIRSRGPKAVENSLLRAGLPGPEWQRLLIQSGAASGPAGGGGAGGGGGDGVQMPAGLGTLALVLERFDRLMRAGPEGRSSADRMVDDIREGVESATKSAEKNVEKLGSELTPATSPVMEGRGTEMNRDTLLETLAEIAQDLLQPLTVINCAISMSVDGYAGPVAPELGNLLHMAQHSSQRLQKIMDALIRIVGYPTRLTAPGPANRV